MNKIETLEQLEMEIRNLREVTKQKELQFKNNLKEIREDLKPENILLNTFSSITGIRIDKNSFLKEGLAYTIFIIIQRFLLKTEKKAEDKTHEFLDTIFERIRNFVKKFRSHEINKEN